jgi:ABC-type xylose transport system permease subunit
MAKAPPTGILLMMPAIFPQHCFIAKRVRIGSRIYFTGGPKRSTSSFQEAMIFAFVFRAL